MFSTTELWREIMRVGGVKRISAATGRPAGTLYRWTEDDERNLLDWVEAVVQVLALRPDGRAILVRLHHFTNELFRRALDGNRDSSATVAELRNRAVAALRETADVVEKCNADAIDRDELVREALEARDVLDRMIADAAEDVPQPRLRAAR